MEFKHPWIPMTKATEKEMLESIGKKSLDELFSNIPKKFLLKRDLDIPQAEVMVVCDSINTSKTMYQKFKRTRGGLVILLAYSGTSEERKVSRLMTRILERYPWSTAVVETESESLG